jgi:hypothetical protein
MTLAQIIDHCQLSYNSATGDDFFPIAWYVTAIWKAESELAIQGWVIERTFTTTSVDGTRSLAFPSNCLAVREVKYDNTWLKKVTLKDDTKTSLAEPEGDPTSYAIWNNTVYMFPTPNTNGDTITLRCYMAPDQLVLMTDPLNVPDEYQIQLVDYVLAQMAIKDQNIALGQLYLQKWEQTVERARQQRKRRMVADQNFVVRDTYFGSAYRTGVYYDGR